MSEWEYEVGLWFVRSGRFVVESDVNDSEDASSESVMLWRYDSEPKWEEIVDDVFLAMEHMREQWLMCGLGLPEIEVVVRQAVGEVWRDQWEW